MLHPIFGALAAASAITYLSINGNSNLVTQPISPGTYSDSTFTASIKAENKDNRPTVIVEKSVPIPPGYRYISHHLDLERAFPTEGMEGSSEWVAGPGHTWSVFSQAKADRNASVNRIFLRATASPGRKSMEISTEATLYVTIQKTKA
ncbi:hypothetical protein [Fibrella aquatilis]|uniref:Uncharacterized protein n=1 Tax=Fibrella aquatilis TaxID=2817059 RepID=A0A939G889_9BACT|nr:hypothetical protein [Fibrella aquatilis]MBO0931881.1 hypothetical protein [Fibrella aquatilis]